MTKMAMQASGSAPRSRSGWPRLAAARSSNEYYFFAGYIVLMFVVLATAWNILGGYAGYVNFGTAGVLRRSAPTPRWC